jgi:hypothetical protein
VPLSRSQEPPPPALTSPALPPPTRRLVPSSCRHRSLTVSRAHRPSRTSPLVIVVFAAPEHRWMEPTPSRATRHRAAYRAPLVAVGRPPDRHEAPRPPVNQPPPSRLSLHMLICEKFCFILLRFYFSLHNSKTQSRNLFHRFQVLLLDLHSVIYIISTYFFSYSIFFSTIYL